jgi:hypothetical protein
MIWLIVSQVLYLLALLPWLIMAGFAFMMFDSGFSVKALLFASGIWTYPLVALSCAILAWLLYGWGNTTGALVATSVPMLWGAPILLFYPALALFDNGK